jgi:hypothetical protein
MKMKPVLAVLMSLCFVVFGLSVASPAQAADKTVGDCTIHANDPHPSGHVSGSINATGTLRCKTLKTSLHINVVLEK